MNIEEILPELFSASSPPSNEKRVYYCQRCLNHGLRYKRKNHKTECSFRFCQCNDCEMISRRRELNSLLRAESSPDHLSALSQVLSHPLDVSTSLTSLSSESDSSPSLVVPSSLSSLLPPSSANSDDGSSANGGTKERRPNCQRCAQHNTTNRLKGHKRNCPFKECNCAKCMVVLERQKLMADQIKLRRKQKKEKMLQSEGGPSPPPDTHRREGPSEVCMKCTQQALSYQQLMSMFEPSVPIDPVATLALLLPLCPHNDH